MAQTPEQQMYLARLMGYDYCIQYCAGNTNLVVDALSRLPDPSKNTMLLLSIPYPTFLEELKKNVSRDPNFIQFRQNINRI